MNKYRLVLILLLIFIIFLFSLKHNKKYEIISISNSKNYIFSDLLPSINSSKKNKIITVFDEFFNSPKLFISDNNLSMQYVSFIRDIKEKDKVAYKDNISDNQQKTEIKFDLNYYKKKKKNIIGNNIDEPQI